MSIVTPVAICLSVMSGWAVIHHARNLMHNGTGIADGGGWAALILAETMICLGAASLAIYA